MKRWIITGSIITFIGTWGLADTPAPSTSTANGNGYPCKEIEQACVNAGFVKGKSAEGKGLFRDCMKPIMDGQTVEGITVDPAMVSDCKQHMGKRHPHVGL